MTAAKGRAARGEVASAILKYFGKRIGQDVHIGDMVHDLGFTVGQIRSAVYNLRMSREVLRRDIIVILSGQTWRYLPRPVDETTATPAAPTTPTPAASTTPEPPPEPAPTTQFGAQDATLDGLTRVLYERIGELNGHTIVRDERGNCFRVEPIELQIDIN